VAKLSGNNFLEVRAGGVSFELPCLVVKTLQRLQFLAKSEPRFRHGRSHDRDRVVVHLEGHGKRMAVLATVRKRKPGRIGETARRAMNDFSHHRERVDRAGTDARNHQKLLEIFRPAIGSRRKCRMQPSHVDVFLPYVVMCRHHEMWEQRLIGLLRFNLRIHSDDFPDNSVRPKRCQKLKLPVA